MMVYGKLNTIYATYALQCCSYTIVLQIEPMQCNGAANLFCFLGKLLQLSSSEESTLQRRRLNQKLGQYRSLCNEQPRHYDFILYIVYNEAAKIPMSIFLGPGNTPVAGLG